MTDAEDSEATPDEAPLAAVPDTPPQEEGQTAEEPGRIDLEALARRVYRLLIVEARIERERLG